MKQMLDKEKYLEYKLHLLDKLNTDETEISEINENKVF